MKKRIHLLAWPALIVVLLDQISKYLVQHGLGRYESMPVISGFFNIVHIRNRGMAFGLLGRPDVGITFYCLMAASLLAVGVLLFWALKFEPADHRIAFGLSLILGGALGNLADRIRHQEVIDFLDFHLGTYHWPAFNVADIAITAGALWMGLVLIIQHSPNR